MTDDARFADGAERPARLRAFDAEDLQVISSLCQDAVLSAADMRWDRKTRRFALLINRFRWEMSGAERVRSILAIDEVTGVHRQGQFAPDSILSILSVTFEPAADGAGRIILTLAGDGAVAISAEALEVTLRDVTRPYAAPSGKKPQHGE